ncbi:hypothetical protein [Kitasatospora sp. NPDC015120]|uniref:hypothetical protein n=1 Tax=Kitasatospora sp. NPDC015120 TaxID=3364023 RepID=UPI0036F47618
MLRHSGPYSTPAEQPLWIPDADVINDSEPPAGQPGLSCQWAVGSDGWELSWNHHSRFYSGGPWIRYLIDTFWRPGCALQAELAARLEGRDYAPEFDEFTFDHVLNGEIKVTEEDGTSWLIKVVDNVVSET